MYDVLSQKKKRSNFLPLESPRVPSVTTKSAHVMIRGDDAVLSLMKPISGDCRSNSDENNKVDNASLSLEKNMQKFGSCPRLRVTDNL